MSVGDIVTLSPFPETWKVVAERMALPLERGPMVLRLESTATGRRLHDFPSSHTTPTGENSMTRILVDLDDTIADWSARYDSGLDASEGSEGIPRSAEHKSFDLFAGRTRDEKRIIRSVMSQESFYAELFPLPGAIESLREMVAEGHEVFIVTSPWVSNPTCASDKLRWVEAHLGTDWGRRAIITADKTVVRGDVLFDDKGTITGIDTPTWTQVLVTQPHNRDVTGLVRLDHWHDWRAALKGALA